MYDVCIYIAQSAGWSGSATGYGGVCVLDRKVYTRELCIQAQIRGVLIASYSFCIGIQACSRIALARCTMT